jgi:ribonuclease HI
LACGITLLEVLTPEKNMAKPKFYVVWKGRKPGIYNTWAECLKQVHTFPEAWYKSFNTQTEAVTAFASAPARFVGTGRTIKPNSTRKTGIVKPLTDCICVDAACSGNPGQLEYRGVDYFSGDELFHMGPYPEGTVNIGEFLAIVHGLAWLKQRNLNLPVYSDSRNGIKWVLDKNVKTTLKRTKLNESLFELMDRALNWLNSNTWENPLLKWETRSWGEIPADFGRK